MKRICKMMKKSMALVFCLNMLCISVNAVSLFPDVPENASYAEAAEVLVGLGVFQGDGQGNFNPDSSITRAQAAAVICRLVGVEEEALTMTQQVFSDVPSSYWAVGTIAKAAELGIISGYSDGSFRPSNPVSQQQMIKMLICAWGYGQSAEEAGGWPAGYTSVAEELGIVGNANAITNVPAKRSEVAAWCYNALFVNENFE